MDAGTSETHLFAALSLMPAGLHSQACNDTGPPGFTLDSPRLVMASNQAILFQPTAPLGISNKRYAVPMKDSQMSRSVS